MYKRQNGVNGLEGKSLGVASLWRQNGVNGLDCPRGGGYRLGCQKGRGCCLLQLYKRIAPSRPHPAHMQILVNNRFKQKVYFKLHFNKIYSNTCAYHNSLGCNYHGGYFLKFRLARSEVPPTSDLAKTS